MDKQKLQLKELDNVVGGESFQWQPDTIMECRKCGYRTYQDRPYPAGFLMKVYQNACGGYWRGYKCPNCGYNFKANGDGYEPDA